MEIWTKSKACQICALGCSTGESSQYHCQETLLENVAEISLQLLKELWHIMTFSVHSTSARMTSPVTTAVSRDVCVVADNVLPLVSELRDETPCGLTKKLLIA